MSREIKFRAWLKDVKQIVEVRHISFFEGKTVIKIYDQPMSEEVWFDLEDLELLQYTGLNDQFNTEIYEGDVVRHDFMVYEGHGSVGEDSTIDIIKNLTELPFGSSSIGCEVIGNIYENPELMEASK